MRERCAPLDVCEDAWEYGIAERGWKHDDDDDPNTRHRESRRMHRMHRMDNRAEQSSVETTTLS
jgi:hypothetical protein